MRFTGHLDLFKTWERIFRRAGLPLAYSQGFHPQPKLNLACALPLGFTSQAEILDAWLEYLIPLQNLRTELDRSAPPGITINQIEEVDLKAPALQTLVSASEYEITFLTPVADLDRKIADILTAPSLPMQRRDRHYDLRPLIENLQRKPAPERESHPCILARLSAREGATGRPEALIEALGENYLLSRVHRLKLVFKDL